MRQKPFIRNNKTPEEKHSINDQITAKEVRLVGAQGEQIGVVKIQEALRLADEAGLDLVEVAAEANPPVCRLLNYGKLKYQEQKRAAESRKKTASNDVKELRIRYSTDQHDLETKVRNARKFLANGDKVRFQMRFKGREVVYQDLGKEIFNQVIEMLKDVATVEEMSPMIGYRMIMTFAPGAAPSTKPAEEKPTEKS